MKQPSVYILTNTRHTTLYIGVTSNLPQRIYQHKNKMVQGFTATYNLYKLIYFEQFDDMSEAILREKRLKKWNRSWKDILITEKNPEWEDLYYKFNI
jgi:putative endonuclease